MTIIACGFEIPETISHTVVLEHEGPGEFSAVYWDVNREAFITIKNVNPSETSVDGSTYEKMLYSLKQKKIESAHNRARPLGLSDDAIMRLKLSLTREQYKVVRHFAVSQTQDAKSRFVTGCIEQIKAWANETTSYPFPLTDNQWKILNRIYYSREI
jgi:hypothetical protein